MILPTNTFIGKELFYLFLFLIPGIFQTQAFILHFPLL